MKLTTLLMILGCLHLHAAVFSQTVNITEKNVSLETVFSKIEKQTGYLFFTRVDLLRDAPKVNVNFKNLPIKEALEELLGKLSISYTIVDRNIVIKSGPERIHAQSQLIIIGKVLDERENPMPGVSITLKGTNQQFITNREGQFITTVIRDNNAVLQISYIGYETQELALSALKNPVVIRMKPATSDLDQVQVMAYTTTTKRLNTSNSVTITAAEIARHPVLNVLDIIKDRVPGLFIQQNTGLPGGSYDVNIRGTSSFKASAPLYVIDGVTFPANATLPLMGRSANNNLNNQFLGGNALNYLNPADIESIDILKDADATAIYGSRGAFGVILITTKKGKAGQPRLNINSYTGVVMRGSFPELLNTEQYLTIRREAVKNDGLQPGAGDLDLNGTWSEDASTDWQRELMGSNGLTNTVNASYSGGAGNTNFLVGANYRRQGSTQLGKGSSRGGNVSFDINNTTVNQKFYIDLSGSFTTDLNDLVPVDFSGSVNTVSAPNAPSLRNPDGSLNWKDYATNNPLAALNLNYKNVTNNLIANTELRYKPVKGLTATLRMGYNLLTGNEFSSTPTTFFNPAINSSSTTTSYVNNFGIRTLNFDPNLRYQLGLGKKGTLNAIVAARMQDMVNTSNQIRGTNFTTDALLVNPANAITVVPAFGKFVTRNIGFNAQLNYNWDNKYILNLNGSSDGSTKFAPGSRIGNFGSIGAAWLLSEETWFKNNVSFISFVKINGSVGVQGADGIDNYLYLDRYVTSSTPYQLKNTLTPFSPSSPELHWEKKRSADIALRVEFLNGRIRTFANYFRNVSSDLLTLQPLAGITGFSNYNENSAAKIENKGYEATLDTWNIMSNNFKWSTGFQISVYRNKVLAYPNVDKIGNNFSVIEGKTVNGLKLLKYSGVDPQTGFFLFTTPDGVTAQNLFTLSINRVSDRTEFVDLQPRFYGSISNNFTYKAFSLGFAFTGRKRMGLNFLGQQSNTPGFYNVNTSVSALRRWQQPGDITDVPKATTNFLTNAFQQILFRQSTGAYEMITYARLQNMDLNYNFSPEFLKKANISVMNIFLRGENLLTISKYGDMDPDNLNVSSTPQMKIFTAGFNVTF